MDNHYDANAAAGATLSKKGRIDASSTLRTLRHALNLLNPIQLLTGYKVDDLCITEMVEGRRSWRLSLPDVDDDVSDEIIVRVQGILTRNKLVPINARSCPSNKAQFLTQSAEIDGMRTATFDAAMASLASVDQRFSDFLAGTDIMGCSEEAKRRGRGLLASNKIFSFRSDVPTEQDTGFQDGVDPVGALARLKTGDLIHAPDNIVKYYKRVQDLEASTHKYETYFPGGFHAGDIVEMQVTFVAISMGAHKAATARREQAMRGPISNPAVRRKVGYFAEDDEDERRVKQRQSESPDGEAANST
ncbi:hypothetical protein C8R46DRAFT_1042787 [Mycena filopes]|nr:hypothetical protein C8R46DRAFT_1042691 [Mycena filopes]KAJ7152530.1 hypothetical protein C8R46DRAFT_1042787 [Mycena filopes]